MPATIPPADPSTKSIFASRTYAGLALVAVPILLRLLGVQASDAEVETVFSLALQLSGLVLAIYGRQRASARLTLTGAPSAPTAPPPAVSGDAGFVSPATLAAVLLVALFALASVLVFAGCSTVESVGAGGTYDPATGAAGGNITVALRAPRGFSK